jgi:hypothetical protein
VKVIARTDEYTIYQKRNERYAVRDAQRAWVNGDAKVAILLEHKLVTAPAPKPAEPEPAAEEEVAAAAETAEDAPESADAPEASDEAAGDAEEKS